MYPPPQTEKLLNTHILETAIRQLSVPLILNLCNLPGCLVIEDVDFAVDGLFLADSFCNVAGLEVHLDGVAGTGNFVVEALDFFEGGLETVLWWDVKKWTRETG